MGLGAAIIIDFRESIDGPAPHRYIDSLPRAKGQVEVEGDADPARREELALGYYSPDGWPGTVRVGQERTWPSGKGGGQYLKNPRRGWVQG